MKAFDQFLRRFKRVRWLENRVVELEGDKADLRRDVADLERANARLVAEAAEREFVFPPGHFYSPQTSRAEVAEVFAREHGAPTFAGMELNEAEQGARLHRFAEAYAEQPFPETATAGRRYFLNNPSYGAYDGIMLYLMLRETGARRVIEVGSGFSSAAMLDLNEFVFSGRMRLTLQEVPLATFAELEAGDVLFIDSSHVSKLGSDVNRLFFDVLPVLKPGVWVHIHDVTGNLEYPREWFDEGRSWNELYLLRAFLMYNRSWRIELFTGWIFNTHNAFLRERMPLCAGGGGGQIWLRKVAE
jgi:hypothetical protein